MYAVVSWIQRQKHFLIQIYETNLSWELKRLSRHRSFLSAQACFLGVGVDYCLGKNWCCSCFPGNSGVSLSRACPFSCRLVCDVVSSGCRRGNDRWWLSRIFKNHLARKRYYILVLCKPIFTTWNAHLESGHYFLHSCRSLFMSQIVRGSEHGELKPKSWEETHPVQKPFPHFLEWTSNICRHQHPCVTTLIVGLASWCLSALNCQLKEQMVTYLMDSRLDRHPQVGGGGVMPPL